MYDLVYDTQETASKVKEKFPEAIIEDASDFVHEHRFSVELPDEKELEFYVFATEELFLDLCLGFHSHFKDGSEKSKKILDAVEEKMKEVIANEG